MSSSKKNPRRPGVRASKSRVSNVKKRRSTPAAIQSNPSLIFEQARQLFNHNAYKKTIDILLDKLRDVSILGKNDQLEYYRLLSFSLPQSERYLEAEDFANKGLAIAPDDGDFYFVLAYIAFVLKDFDRCLANGKKYLNLCQESESGKNAAKYLSYKRRHLLYNFLGSAYRSKSDFEKAVESFEIAMRLDPEYHHPYINLANLYLQRREYAKATEVIERGLAHCSQVQELRILKKSLENRVTISACMIVRNEEEFLPQCLQSIRNWVDEIIVVDTGSTDRTVEIAASYGAKIFHQAWEGDFSKPRNYSLAQAVGDWIFVIDADEEFVEDDVALLRQAISQDKFRLISITVYNMNKATGECTSFLPSYRLFRRDAGFRYEGIVHNQLCFGSGEPALRAGIRLRHYGYSLSPEKMKKKIARSRELLEKQLQERPDDPHVHFNYAQLLRGMGADLELEICQLILEHAARAIELSSLDMTARVNTYLMAHHQMITTHIYLKNYEEAERLCYKALETKADYLDPVLSLGHIYTHVEKLDKAEEFYKKYLEMQARYDESRETTNLILLYLRSRQVAYYGLGIIALYRNDISQAMNYFNKILQEHGPYLDTYLKLARLHLDRHEFDKAKEFIDQESAWHPESDLAYLYLAEYYGGLNNRPAAEDSLGRALELTRGNPEVYERAGCFYARTGAFRRAIQLFQNLLRVRPSYHYGLRLLARAYYDEGSYADAIIPFKQYIERRPDDVEALIDTGNCYFKLKSYQPAEELYRKALNASDAPAAVYRNLGLTK